MSQIPRAELYRPSFEIAESPEEHGFDRRPKDAFDMGREPAVITGAYMTGDPEDPPLRQMGLMREDIAGSTLKSAVFANAAGEIALKNLPFVPDSEMSPICEQIKEALGEMEGPPEDEGFAIITQLAIYEVQGLTIPHAFISREFVDKLSQKVEVVKPNEDEVRQLYSIQAEHNPDIEPFDEWVEAIEEVIARAGSDEQVNRVAAENYLNLLVVPRPYMHRVVGRSLFERD